VSSDAGYVAPKASVSHSRGKTKNACGGWESFLLGSVATAWRCCWIQLVDFPLMPTPGP
jgi:hypothetical protein